MDFESSVEARTKYTKMEFQGSTALHQLMSLAEQLLWLALLQGSPDLQVCFTNQTMLPRLQTCCCAYGSRYFSGYKKQLAEHKALKHCSQFMQQE